MKNYGFAAVVLSFLLVLSCSKGYEVTKTSDSYTVRATIDNNPPIIGENTVTVGIVDPSGKPVTDAQVRVDYGMPAMPGMPAMNYRSEAQLKGTAYVAQVNPSMAGGWNFAVYINRGGKIERVTFNVDVK